MPEMLYVHAYQHVVAAAAAAYVLIQDHACTLMWQQIERTPLHHACFTRDPNAGAVVDLLLRAGAVPNALDCVRWGAVWLLAMRRCCDTRVGCGDADGVLRCSHGLHARERGSAQGSWHVES